jgi:hypothetical protein
MATILEFPRPRVRLAPEAVFRDPGEIVIFPGVRIERLEFDLAERLPPPPRRRRPQESRLAPPSTGRSET